jgi:erythronate-4-phosphate dehydrogenase
MRVMLNDPPRAEKEGICGFLSIESILRESDIISFHVPLILEGKHSTFHMAGEKMFSNMRKGSILINSSRGEVVNTQALNSFLNSGKFSAMLDVWENEPELDLEALKNADIATPHIAGYSLDGKANGTAMSVSALSKFFNLPLVDWYPDEIPSLEISDIYIDAHKRSYQSVLTDAVLNTYNIESDDKKLRNNPMDFESLRGNYPIRREFNAWTIHLLNDNRNFKSKLENLGFVVKA